MNPQNPDEVIDFQFRLHKPWNIILTYVKFLFRCEIFYPPGLGQVEAIVYTIDEINKNDSILPNFTLGYDVRDFCLDTIIAAKHTYQFAIATNMNCKTVKCISDYQCICFFNESSVHEEVSGKNYSTNYPVVGVVGALLSRVAIPLANFFQAVKIPLIDWSATSEELSSSIYESFFRTVPSDVNQAKAFADIIDHFGWR
jgi:hypothetical protein